MKRKVIVFAGAVLVAPLLLFGSVAAQDGASGSGSTDSSKTQTTAQADSSQTTTDSPKDQTENNSTLEDRIATRKAELKTKLTLLQQNHLKAVCKSAQGKTTSTQARVKGLSTSRGQIYGNVTTKLNELVTKLQAKNVDVTQLQAEITSLQDQIKTFKTDLSAYQQAVDDLTTMDCVSDPTGFKASLDAARAARDKVVADSAAIKAYVNGTIKPTLQQIREQLAKTEDTTTDSKESSTDSTTKETN